MCNRLGHIAIYCKDVKCYACGKKGHIARHCSLNRSHSSYSFESNQSGYSSDNSHSNEGKPSAVRFTQYTTGIDNALKQRVRVNGTYTYFAVDTGAEVSIITEATSRILSLALEKSDRILSGADGSPLSILGKSEVLLENN